MEWVGRSGNGGVTVGAGLLETKEERRRLGVTAGAERILGGEMAEGVGSSGGYVKGGSGSNGWVMAAGFGNGWWRTADLAVASIGGEGWWDLRKQT